MSAIYGGGGGNRHSVFYGGSENVVGAYKDYESSAESAAKRDMVRKILTVFENLKFEGLPSFPTSDDPVELSEVADKLKEVVYKKLKRGLKDDDDVRKKLCKAIARELNSVFGRTVVNEDYNVDSVCTQVNEFCLSFARGLHLEYFRVQNDVKISIKNIRLLLEVMEKTSAQVNELITSTKDNQAIGKYKTIANIYNAAQQQLKQQMDVLENLMNIKTPAQMPLAFEPGSDMKPLIESIGIKVSDFGKNYSDNILSSLYGMVSIAVIAARVHKALKDVGLSVSDYKNFGSINELKNKLSDAVGTRTENFSSFEESQKVLEKNFKSNVGEDDWGKLLEALEKTGGAIKHLHDEYNEDGSRRYDKEGNLITPFEKQIDAQYNEKAAIIRSFSTQIATKYENLLKALDELVRNFDKITIDDKSNVIRTNLANLVSHEENERIELALIGVFDTINAREAREMFMMSLKNIMRSCDGVSGFEGLHAAVKSLYELIEHFYETARPKFGGAKEDRKKFSDLVPEINRSGLSLKAGINKFVYFYYLAKIRINSAKSADAIEDASNNYVKLMGLAVGTRINDLKSKLTIMSYNIDGKTDKGENGGIDNFGVGNRTIALKGTAATFKAAVDISHFLEPKPEDNDAEKTKFTRAQYKKFIENRIKVLENFYAAVQALDLYLKAFTVEINQHPEKVAELKKMINETEMIGSWYNDKTGDKLCDYFNNSIYPSGAGGAGLPANAAGSIVWLDDDKLHYYEKIATLTLINNNLQDRTTVALNNNAGADLGGVNIKRDFEVLDGLHIVSAEGEDNAHHKQRGGSATAFGDHIARYDLKKKHVDDAFDNFTGFKNLMNIFAKIGNVESKSVFLSPSQMYKYFSDFMKNNSIDISKVCTNAHYLLGIVESAAVGPISAFDAFGCVPMNFENKLFAHCLKAMTGKVFVTVGFYEILHNITPVGMINQTRIILGGGMKNLEAVDAKADVAELYFRLPRLVEFYRNTLIKDYSKANSTGWAAETKKVITMLPDISGTFSGILKAIFKITDSSEEITYSDEQLRTIIDEANKIHDVYHNTTDAVNALIADVNSRFGMVMKKTLKQYYDDQDALREDFKAGTANETNYQLFSDEGAAPSGKAPSEMYVNSDVKVSVELKDNVDIQTDAETKDLFGYSQLKEFHTLINRQFESIIPKDLGKSFDLFIQYGARKIAEAKDKEARMSVAFSLIQDNKNYDVDPLKLQMFQETVVVGLNALKHIDDALDNFMKNIYILRLVRARQEQACVNDTVSAANNTANEVRSIVDNANPHHGLIGIAATDLLPRVFSSVTNNNDASKYIVEKIKKLSIYADLVRCFRFKDVSDADDGKTLKIDANNAKMEYGGAVVLTAVAGNNVESIDVEPAVMCRGWTSGNELRQQEKAAMIHTVTNYNRCMQLYLENLFTFIQGSNGLVTVDITDKDAKVNISKLKNRIDSILSGVKEYISLFRNFMPEKYIDKYVKSENDVSVFSIEKTLIYDKFDNTKDDDNLTLSFALRLNSVVHKWLLADKPDLLTFWRGPHNGVIGITGAVKPELKTYKPYPYGLCLGELVYKFNKLTTNTTVTPAAFVDIAVNNKPFYKALGMMTQSGDQVWPQPGYGRIDFDDRDKEFKLLNVCDSENDIGSGSLIQSINQLMLRLVNVCSEISPNVKTYSTLVNTVCAGPFGNVLKDVSKQSLPDLAQTTLRVTVGKNELPKARDVVSRYNLFLNGFVNTDNAQFGVAVDAEGDNIGYPKFTKQWAADLNNLGLLPSIGIERGGILPKTSIAKMLAAIFRWHLQNYVQGGVSDYRDTLFDIAGNPNSLGYAHDDREILPEGCNVAPIANDARTAGAVNKKALDEGVNVLNYLLDAVGEQRISNNTLTLFRGNSAIYTGGLQKHAPRRRYLGDVDYAALITNNILAVRAVADGGDPGFGPDNGNGAAAGTAAKFTALNNEILAIIELLKVIYKINNKFLTHYKLTNDPSYLTLSTLEDPNFLVNYAGPEKDQLLLSSLAYILRTVNASVVKNTSVPSNMTLSLTDVPLYVREQMRANLPVFIHMFDLLNKKAEFLLQFSKLALKDDHFMNYQTAGADYDTTIALYATLPPDQRNNCKRLQPGMAATDVRKYQLHPYMTNLGSACRSFALANPNDKDYLMTLLNKIAETTFTLYDSCNNVLQELGDIGVFGQTHEGFLESYERRYKLKPITPYSLYLTMLTNTSSDVAKLVDVSGTADFKRNYAIRGLLNGPVSEEVLPYNAALKIENDYFKFLNNVHDLINHHYNGLLLNKFNKMFKYSSKRFVIGKQFKKNEKVLTNNAGVLENMDDVDNVVTSIIEEPNQKLYIAKLIEQFTDSDDEDSRAKEITRNIVDLNVIPFNVNLLMRDIPLTNIYNYSLAFEKFIKMFIGTQNNSNTGKLFVKLMQEPYLDLSKYDITTDKAHTPADAAATIAKISENLHELKNIFIGDDSLGMGRPKFLSDQLFNKVLTQSVYDNRHDEKLPAINTNIGLNTDLIRTLIRYIRTYKTVFSTGFQCLFDFNGTNDAVAAANTCRKNGTGEYGPVRRLSAVAKANGGNVTKAQIDEQSVGFPITTAHLRTQLRLSATRILANITAIRGDPTSDPADANHGANVLKIQAKLMDNAGAAITLRDFINPGANAGSSVGDLLHDIEAALSAGSADNLAAGSMGEAIGKQLFNLDVHDLYIVPSLNKIKDMDECKSVLVAGNGNLHEFVNMMLKFLELCRVYICMHSGQYNYVQTPGAVINRDAFAAANFIADDSNIGIANKKYLKFAHDYNNAFDSLLKISPVGQDGAMVINFNEPEKNLSYKHAVYNDRLTTEGGSLSYVGKDGQVHHIGFPAATMQLFDKNYEYRFNTTVVRNLFFITNLNRVLRLLFEKTLTYSRNVIKHGLEFTNPSLTEYGQFPMLPNETYSSKQNNKLDRYARGDKPNDFHDSKI